MRLSIRRGGLRAVYSRRAVLSAAIVALCFGTMFACTDSQSDSPVGPSGPGAPIRLSLVPRLHVLDAQLDVAPINLARLTVLDAQTRDTIAGPFTITVDPASPVFTLPISFELEPGDAHADVVVVVELLNVTNGEQTVQWSGITSSISVTAGAQAPPPAPITVFQGPSENLSVTSILITNKPASLLEGDSVQLLAIAQGNSSAQIFWRSTDTTIVRVSSSGIVRVVRSGAASIIAAAGPREDTARITLRARPASIRIAPDTMRAVSFNDEIVYTATVADARGAAVTGEAVTWSSSDESIVSSLGGGRFSARGNGTAVIRAAISSVPAVQTVATAIVNQRVATMTLDVGAFDLTAIGDRHTFVAVALDARGNVVVNPGTRWTSSNPAAVTIDNAGNAAAVSAGASTVTATSADGTSTTATVTVRQVVTALSITPPALSLTSIGDTARLVVRATDHNGATIVAPVITFATSNGSVATVDPSGLVRAIGRGSCTITVSSAGVTALASVLVEQLPARVEVTPPVINVSALGATGAFAARVVDRNGNPMAGAVTWTASNPAVATVNASGVATATGNGTASITASFGAVNGAAIFTVQQTVARVVASPDSMTLTGVGVTIAFHAQAFDAGGSIAPSVAFIWSSLDPAIATVDANGATTSTGFGTARIVVSAGTAADTIPVTVVHPVLIITPDSVRFTGSGATQQLTSKLLDAGGNLETVSPAFTSGNPAVVTVSTSGLLTSQAPGSTIVIGRVGDVADTVRVTVVIPVSGNLRIDTVYVTPPDNIVTGSTPTIHIGGQSSGATGVGATVALMQFLNASNVVLFQATQNIPPLAAGQVISFDVPFTIPGGTPPVIAHVRVTADATNLVVESSETDNIKEFGPIHLVAPLPPAVVLSRDTVSMAVTDSLTLTAVDQNGATVAPTFVSTHDAVATVDPNTGYITAVANGFTRIVATYLGHVDTTFIQVGPGLPALSGVTKTWIASADPTNNLFDDPNNWKPRGVPTTSDFIFMPDCAVFYFELNNGSSCTATFSSNRSIGGITTGYFYYYYDGGGAQLTQGAQNGFALARSNFTALAAKHPLLAAKPAMGHRARLDSVRNVRFGAALNRAPVSRNTGVRSSAARNAALNSAAQRIGLPTAAARIAAISQRMSSTVPRSASARNAGTLLDRNAAHVMEQSDPHLDLNGHTLTISGDVNDLLYIGDSSGDLPTGRVVLNGSDQDISGLETETSLDVTGSNVRISHEVVDCYYCSGFMQVRGNLAISGKLSLDGNVSLRVYPQYSSINEISSLGDLIVNGELHVAPSGYVNVSRDIQVSGSGALLSIIAADMEAERDLLISSGTFDLGNSAFAYIARDLRTSANGLFKMQGSDADMEVQGNASFRGASTNGMMTEGYLYLYHDLEAGGVNATAFAPSGNHLTEFDNYYYEEYTNHNVNFTSPGSGAAGSHFASLELYNASLSSDLGIFIDGDGRTYDAELGEGREYDAYICGGVSAPAVTINGGLYLCSGGEDWTVPTTTMRGPDSNIYLGEYNGSITTNLIIEGTTYTTNLHLQGNMTVTGPQAHFATGGSSVTVSGTLSVYGGATVVADNYSHFDIVGDIEVSSGSVLNMENNATLVAEQNLHLANAGSVWNSGEFRLGGNLIADVANAVVAAPGHVTALIGDVDYIHVISLPAGANTLGGMRMQGRQQLRVVFGLNLAGDFQASIAGDITGPTIRSTNGTQSLKVAGVSNIDHLTLQDVILDIRDSDSGPRTTVSYVTFAGISTVDAFQLIMRMDHDSSSFSMYNVQFDDQALTEPTYNFVELFGHDVDLYFYDSAHGASIAMPTHGLVTNDATSTIHWSHPE